MGMGGQEFRWIVIKTAGYPLAKNLRNTLEVVQQLYDRSGGETNFLYFGQATAGLPDASSGVGALLLHLSTIARLNTGRLHHLHASASCFVNLHRRRAEPLGN
jgi:hypothetical protein